MKPVSTYIYFGILSFFLLAMESCTNSNSEKEPQKTDASEISTNSDAQTEESSPDLTESDSEPRKLETATDFSIPKGYVLFQRIDGDLSGDGEDDCVLIVKNTKAENIVQDEYKGEQDRNRRGIMIYLNKDGVNTLVTENLSCFSSENEDGGIYFPPELTVEIENGKLFLHYHHGRYGFWTYTFRFNGSDFDLIGYDSSDNHGPIVNQKNSINFLTKKKQVRINVNQETEESGEEVFEETWEGVELDKLIQLSEIKDFDALEVG